MNNLYKDIFHTINSTQMFNNCTGCILAVSGGSDSMAMLDFFYSNRSFFNFDFVVAHVHHGLRKESDDELIMVKNYCLTRQIKCETIELKLLDSKPVNVSTEAFARQKRYEFFELLRKKYGYSHIATAHNANDNAETLLMHIVRGCGTEGACGIPETRSDNIVRPLCDIDKKRITEHCINNKIPYAVDQTNFENICTRNIFRNEIIPSINKINPSFISSANEFTKMMKSDTNFIDSYVETVYNSIVNEENYSIQIDKAKMLHQSILGRIIRKLYSLLSKNDLSYKTTIAVCNLIDNAKTSSQISLPGDVIAYKSYKYVLLLKKEAIIKQDILPTSLKIGENIFGSKTYVATSVQNNADIDISVLPNCTIRSYKNGDSICINKKTGTKKLNKLFCDAKIPGIFRKDIPVIEYNGNVIFVYGFGTSFKYKPKNSGIKISIKKY